VREGEVNVSKSSFFRERFEGYSKGEWRKLYWCVGTYHGVPFNFQDLQSKVLEIVERNIELEDYGTFWMKSGFLKKFLELEDYGVALGLASLEELSKELSIKRKSLTVAISKNSEIFKELSLEIPAECLERDIIFTHRTLNNSDVLVIATESVEKSQSILQFLDRVKQFIKNHEIWRGFSFVTSGRYMVTPLPIHPAKLVSLTLRLGYRWALFVGPGEDLAVKELSPKLAELGIDFTALSGQFTGDGKCLMIEWESYLDPQASTFIDACQMKNKEKGLLFGVFGNLIDPDIDILEQYVDGYAFQEGNLEYIEKINKPFIVFSALNDFNDIPASMWLFVEKSLQDINDEDKVIKAILSKKAVGVFSDGRIAGPTFLVNVVKLLLADEEVVKETFGEGFLLLSELKGDILKVNIINNTDANISGILRIKTNGKIKVEECHEHPLVIKAGEKKEEVYKVSFKGDKGGSYELVYVEFAADGKVWKDICWMEIPPLLTTLPMLITESKTVDLPISVYCTESTEKILLDCEVLSHDGKRFNISKELSGCKQFSSVKSTLSLDLGEGFYTVTLRHKGETSICRVAVHEFKGAAVARLGDYDGDGLEEAVLENEYVIAKVIPVGGRLLQFRLKDVEADLLFKLYPKKPLDWRVSGRKRRFYPFGGLEEFIQQPTVETFEMFDLSIVKKEGSSAIVDAEADIKGNKIKKTFKLFGGAPLLEVKYEVDFVNPELNVIGVNPLIKLGNNVDSSHVIYYPTQNGIAKERYRGKLYGKRLHLTEDWIACYDEEEKLGLITVFDAKKPFLVHIWMNTPENPDSHYSYIEIQPWIRVEHGTTTYFTYYLYGFRGDFNEALAAVRRILGKR
jgi:hypothetical protein